MASYFKMKTIICDIDGTLTNMEPIEKIVLSYLESKGKINRSEYYTRYNRVFLVLEKNNLLPNIQKYPMVNWIRKNKKKFNFVYVTGGMKSETIFALNQLGISKYFDLKNSISKDTYRFSKKSGIPFKKLKSRFKDCIVVTDSKNDCKGAQKAKIPYILIRDTISIPESIFLI